MTPATAWHVWFYRILYLVLAFCIIAYRLLPLDLGQTGLDVPERLIEALPPSDLLLALTLAWTLRQPAVVPMGLIVVAFLTADFLFQRPPGLFTAIVLLVTEWLKARRAQMMEVNFLFEWTSVAGAIFAILILERMVLWLLVAQQTTLGLTLMHGLMTVAVYPLVVMVSRYLFGLRRLGPAESEALRT